MSKHAPILLLALVFFSAAPARASGSEWEIPPEARDLRNPVPGSTLSRQRGAMLFAKHCVACHGDRGRGDGPSAAEIRVKPADLTREKTIAALSDGELYWKIAYGRDPMPPFKRILPDTEIWHLANFVRTIPAHANDPAPVTATASSLPTPILCP
jgi:mono/diheme cytochrome c family protein